MHLTVYRREQTPQVQLAYKDSQLVRVTEAIYCLCYLCTELYTMYIYENSDHFTLYRQHMARWHDVLLTTMIFYKHR
jgi:hypothetical protein